MQARALSSTHASTPGPVLLLCPYTLPLLSSGSTTSQRHAGTCPLIHPCIHPRPCATSLPLPLLSSRYTTKLQALVYDILPSTTAVFSYAIGSRKLSANEQFFVRAQTVVNLLQTTQIISHVCFITDHVAYASSNKTKIV